MRSVKDCKLLISRLGLELDINPRKISQDILSEEDKQDMIEGRLTEDELKAHLIVWKNSVA